MRGTVTRTTDGSGLVIGVGGGQEPTDVPAAEQDHMHQQGVQLVQGHTLAPAVVQW
jgi:hypothetical protein